MNLRARIRPTGIRCIPWRIWRGELEFMPISSQTLFCRDGLSLDLWEITLTGEGFLAPGENLLDLLRTESALKRIPFGEESFESAGDFPDDWTEEDFIHFYERA